MEKITFYFSFRSPYAWLAYHRLGRAFAGLPVEIDRIPVFPPPNFPNDPAAVPAKLDYIFEDAGRIAAAYGLPWNPETADADWIRPHAAYYHAVDRGKGDEFALAVFAARFSRAENVGDDAVLREVARSVGLDPDAVARAADDPETQSRLWAGMQRAAADRIFGVPTFLYKGERFWGNDRIEWLLRAIHRDFGDAVPDLTHDPMPRPV